MINKNKYIFTSAAAGYLKFFITFFILWFLTPYIIKSVGIEDFGLWTLVFSVLGFYELLDLGFANGVVKYVAECDALKEFHRRNQLLSTILCAYILLSVVGMGALGILAYYFSSLFDISPSQSQKALALLGVLSFRSLIFGLPAALFRGVLYGEKKIALSNAVSAASSLLYGISAFIAMGMGYGIVSLGVLTSATFLLEAMGYVYFSYYYTPQLKLSWSLVDFSKLRELTSFCLMQFVANVSSMLILKTDPIIIQLFTSLFYVSIYAIPLRVVTYVYMFINQFTDVLSPFIAHLHAIKEHKEIQTLFLECTKYSMALATLFMILGVIFADHLILLWLGDQFALSITPLIILLVSMWINSTYLVSGQVLAMSGHHRILTVFFLISAVVHVVLSIALVYPFGIIGVAIATLLCALFGFIIYNKRVCNEFQISYRTYFKSAILSLVIPGSALTVVELAIKSIAPPSNLLFLILATLPGAIVYGVLFWLFSLKDSEKADFKALLTASIPARNHP